MRQIHPLPDCLLNNSSRLLNKGRRSSKLGEEGGGDIGLEPAPGDNQANGEREEFLVLFCRMAEPSERA